jgi:hypothetical protein
MAPRRSLPEFERRLAERLLARFSDRRVLAHGEQPTRLEHEIRGLSVTLYELRPAYENPSVRVRAPVARFRFDPGSGLWTLHWRDPSGGWRRYGEHPPTRNLEALLSEVDRDPTRIFWG